MTFSGWKLIQLTAAVLLTACGLRAEAPVAFLPSPPVIDGILDAQVQNIPVHDFPVVVATSQQSHGTPGLKPSYRLAYGTGFFYVYIEVDSTDVVRRDRAYQNGDGIQLALTIPDPGNAPTDEFYVMGFSIAPDTPDSWQKKFIWYRNVDLSFTPLKSAVLATKVQGGKTGIELLLPWTDVYPYHPWISEAIGFNLRYVKAVGETDKVEYSVVNDDRLDSEQSPRQYTRLQFEPPKPDRETQAYGVLTANHVAHGAVANARLAILAPSAQRLKLGASIVSGEGSTVSWKTIDLPVDPGLSVHEIALPTSELPPGGYSVRLAGAGIDNISRGLTVLPPYEPQELKTRLSAVRQRLKPGSFRTLEFQQEEIEAAAEKLKSYDIATGVRFLLAQHLEYLQAAEQGRDVIALRAGAFRRAYRSKVDGTLQPYSVRIPARFEPGKLYPVIVYLHGSGEDDQKQLRDGFLPGKFIQVAPRGRGTSNAYSADHAQDDIREAVDDVFANYPADPKRIILSGFSMGGYGVYRTFYESPHRYRALAVLSGHPDVARQYLGGDHPNFLDAAFLKDFRGIPVFVFHGGKDRNCPIELTRELVGKLRDAGAQVEFHYEEGKGHESPSPETMKAFVAWLDRMVAQP